MEPDLSAQKATDKQANGDEKQQTQEQIIPANVKTIPHSISFWDHFDTISKLLAGIAFVSWMVQEWILPHNKIFLFIAIVFGLADIFYLVAHKFLPRNRFLIVLSWAIYSICICLIAKNSAKSTDSNAPTLSTDVVRLGDGNYSVKTTIAVFNPSDFPVYGVVLQMHVNGNGVRADSVNIKMPDEDSISQKFPPGDQTIYADAFTIRWDSMQEPTNQSIVFEISIVPPKGRRFVEISGTLTTNSSAEIIVKKYDQQPLEIFKNGITNMFYSP